MNLNDQLKNLVRQKSYPCISYRGSSIWRAHVNGAGNYWHDANTPCKALTGAIELWKKAGKRMDGYAATATREI